eukprot:TRINITY_DN16984_c0_g1_i1.p1 TRINITY_DN16984_c0_g1~~TRINITY_DN16984_c0_g1_i1.p1  ORF type:complete len:419 (+),score=124.70 TRINITY_DN16984_c0_g1_i1:63-1319(+)
MPRSTWPRPWESHAAAPVAPYDEQRHMWRAAGWAAKPEAAGAARRLDEHDAALFAEVERMQRANASLRAVAAAPPLCSGAEADDVLRRTGCFCHEASPDASPRFAALCDVYVELEAAERLALLPVFADASESHRQKEVLRRDVRRDCPLVDWDAFEAVLAGASAQPPVPPPPPAPRPPSPPRLPSSPRRAASPADAWSPTADWVSEARRAADSVLDRANQISLMATGAANPQRTWQQPASPPRHPPPRSPPRAADISFAAPPCDRCRCIGEVQPPLLPPPAPEHGALPVRLRALRDERRALLRYVCAPRGVPPAEASEARRVAADVAARRRALLSVRQRLQTEASEGAAGHELLRNATSRLQAAVLAQHRTAARRLSAAAAADRRTADRIRGMLAAAAASGVPSQKPRTGRCLAAIGR